MKTFFTLLQILLAELEKSAVDDSASKDVMPKADKVTVVARRILPALHHYSSWLLTISSLLVAYKEEKDTPLSVQIAEFWKVYANTLTLLALTFEVVHLPDVDYLLEEDEESLGFAPLDQEATSRRYVDTEHTRKPRMHDEGVERSHPNIEMLYRIREFVIDGLDLVVGNVRDTPYSLAELFVNVTAENPDSTGGRQRQQDIHLQRRRTSISILCKSIRPPPYSFVDKHRTRGDSTSST